MGQRKHWLVFSEQRFFGRIRFHQGKEEPEWWRNLPPSILDRRFTAAAVDAFLRRHPKTPLKALLLMQGRFPGLGDWMVDEILWRARLHPIRPGGGLGPGGGQGALARHARRLPARWSGSPGPFQNAKANDHEPA